MFSEKKINLHNGEWKKELITIRKNQVTDMSLEKKRKDLVYSGPPPAKKQKKVDVNPSRNIS